MKALKKHRMFTLRMTLAELSKRAGLCAQRLSQIESGIYVPIFREKRKRLAKVYELSLEQFEALLEGKDRAGGPSNVAGQKVGRRVRHAG